MATTAQSPAAAALQAGLDAVERGDFLDAYGFFNTALASTADPAQQAQALRGRSRAYRSMRQFPQAQADASAALALQPTNHLNHNELGLVHWERGDAQSAYDCFLAAARLAPGDSAVAGNVKLAKKALKKQQKTCGMSRGQWILVRLALAILTAGAVR